MLLVFTVYSVNGDQAQIYPNTIPVPLQIQLLPNTGSLILPSIPKHQGDYQREEKPQPPIYAAQRVQHQRKVSTPYVAVPSQKLTAPPIPLRSSPIANFRASRKTHSSLSPTPNPETNIGPVAQHPVPEVEQDQIEQASQNVFYNKNLNNIESNSLYQWEPVALYFKLPSTELNYYDEDGYEGQQRSERGSIVDERSSVAINGDQPYGARRPVPAIRNFYVSGKI